MDPWRRSGRGSARWVRATEAARQGLRQLLAHRLRTALALLGIVVGVGAVVGSSELLAGLDAMVRASWERLGGAQVGFLKGQSGRFRAGRFVRFPKAYHVSEQDARALRDAIPEIESLALANAGPVAMASGRVRIDGGWLVGAGAEYLRVRPAPLVRGRFFTPEEDAGLARVVVLNAPLARELFAADPIGEEVRIDGQRFTVIGVLDTFGNRRALVPFATALVRLGRDPRDTNVAIRLRRGASYARIEPELLRLVVSRHPGSRPDSFRSFSLGAFQDREMKEIRARGKMLIAIAALCLLTGGLGVLNVLLISVTERTSEIGLRVALGASRGAVRAQFLLEALLLCAAGGTLGLGAARGLAGGFASAVRAALPPDEAITPLVVGLGARSALLGLGLVLLTALVAGVYPALRASRLDPAQSLRHEG